MTTVPLIYDIHSIAYLLQYQTWLVSLISLMASGKSGTISLTGVIGVGGSLPITLSPLKNKAVEVLDADLVTVPRDKSLAISSNVRFLVSGTNRYMKKVLPISTEKKTRKV